MQTVYVPVRASDELPAFNWWCYVYVDEIPARRSVFFNEADKTWYHENDLLHKCEENITHWLKPIQAVLLSKEDADRIREWIPVSEGLPDFDVKVLVLGEQVGMNPQMGGAYISISKRQDLGGRVRNGHLMQDENQFSLMSYVTHWMPLPEKPKK